MQKNRFCELTVISRFDMWRNCSSKSPFFPRFLTFCPWFLHQECSANLKNGWLCVHKQRTWNYFPPHEEILNVRFNFMQNSCMNPKRLVNLQHVLHKYSIQCIQCSWNSYEYSFMQMCKYILLRFYHSYGLWYHWSLSDIHCLEFCLKSTIT